MKKSKKNMENEEEKIEKKCSCPKKVQCPLDKKCLSKNIIYNATIFTEKEKNEYIGLCSTDFKSRLGVHKQSFKNKNNNQTSLSKFIHKKKQEGKECRVEWKLIDRGKIFSPITGICQLCTKESYHIIFNENQNLLNSCNEIFSSCRHRKGALICNSRNSLGTY